NKQLLEKFNKSQKEIIGQNLLQHVYPADVERAKEEIQKNRKIIYELRVLRGDGSVIHTEVKAYPIIYDGKKCRLLILRDITRRKISESRFLNYHNMMNAFPEAVFIHNMEGKILLSNYKGNHLLGIKEGNTITGTNVMEYVLPEYHKGLREDKEKIDKMGAVAGRYVRIKGPGLKEPKSVEMSVVNVEWENGPAIMAICHDTSLEEQVEKSEMAKQVMESINEHLQWEINEHKQLEAKLQRMVVEKEWLLKEVNHRVKNNLQIITSILNLQINQIQDKKVIPVMREFQKRLYVLSYIYSSLCKTDEVLMEYDQAITCGMIVNELVSNSIKYAFPDRKKGKIGVMLKHTAKQITLEVYDDGVGIKTRKKNQDYQSLGFQLVDSLVTQLKKSKLKQTSGKSGTKYTITFAFEKVHKRTA